MRCDHKTTSVLGVTIQIFLPDPEFRLPNLVPDPTLIIDKQNLFLTIFEKVLLISTGVYILVRKRYLSPPPFQKWYFFPSRNISTPIGPFLPYFSPIFFYFTLLLPIFSFFSFSLSSFFHIFSPKWHQLITPVCRPLNFNEINRLCVSKFIDFHV
jgi:hypothetical protein